MWYLYIVKCKDNSLYTGITTNILRRISEHNGKIGARSLLGKLPVILVYKKIYHNQKDAARREREIKGWKREKKLALIERRINLKRRVYPEQTEFVKGR